MKATFSKTETLRRLRIAAAATREAHGLHRYARVEVNLRVIHQTGDSADAYRDLDGDDLADQLDMEQGALHEEVQEHGSFVHLASYEQTAYGFELWDHATWWIGTPDAEPVRVS